MSRLNKYWSHMLGQMDIRDSGARFSEDYYYYYIRAHGRLHELGSVASLRLVLFAEADTGPLLYIRPSGLLT